MVSVIVEQRFIFFLTYLLEYVQIFNWHNGVWGKLLYFIQNSRPLVKSVEQKNNYLISQPKHML